MQLICPKCHGHMRQYERSGVVIDQCDQCRGVFLDRGELEKLVNAENTFYGQGGHSQGYAQPQPHGYPAQAPPYPPQAYGPYQGHGHHRRKHHGHYRRKHHGFLGEFFD